LSPDALEDGHAPLRKLALVRQGKGGKRPSMIEQFQRAGGKTPLEQLLNAEFLLAKDPDNIVYAEKMLAACVAASYTRTAEWIAQLIFDANRSSHKPSFKTYILLKDAYDKLGLYAQAVNACQLAIELRPEDDMLKNELRDLSAKMTMEKGKYGKAVSFRDSVSNRELQDQLQSQDNVVKSEASKHRIAIEARRQYQQAPTSTTNILQFAEALVDLETKPAFVEAEQLLKNAYENTKDFAFQRKLMELEIKALRNLIRKEQVRSTEKTDVPANGTLAHLSHQLEQKELVYYQQCVENYPTDLRFKYEYGRCLIRNQLFDQAIPLFQEARNDPRLRAVAMDKVGLCFLLKEWYDFQKKSIQRRDEASELGGTMRLGEYPCDIRDKTFAFEAYRQPSIFERHRHRYEFNNQYREQLVKNGMIVSGICPDADLVEIVEIPAHPWFLGCQFHPEFKSRPMDPHPLFKAFIKASLQRKNML